MTLKKTIYTIIVFSTELILSLAWPDMAQAQTTDEIRSMKPVMEVATRRPDYSFARENRNEIQMLFSGLFLFYKNFISSQDGASCSFTPSCSEYGIEAVKRQGVILGIMNTFDRLTRCNSLSQEKYTLHKQTHLLHDPVQ